MAVVRLGASIKTGINLTIDGIEYSRIIPYSVRTKLLNRATSRVEKDIEKLYEIDKNSEDAVFYWLFTKEWIRTDDIRGVWALWFSIEVLNYISQHNQSNTLLLSKGIPRIYRDIIKENINNYNTVNVSADYLNVSTLKRIAKNIGRCVQPLSLISNLFKKSQKGISGVLIETEIDFKGNRYGDISKFIEASDKASYFTLRYGRVYGYENKSVFEIQKDISFSILKISIKKLLRLKSSNMLKRYWDVQTFRASFSSHGYYLGMLEKIIFYNCFEKFVNKSNIKSIVTVSSYHRPDTRIVWYLAQKYNIPSVNIAPRTFNYEKPAENLLKCDIEAYDGKTLPNFFIFRDKFSLRAVIGQKSLIENSFIANRQVEIHKKKKLEKSSCNKNEKSLIILLGNEYQQNQRLLKILISSNIYKVYDKLYVRQHPKYIDNRLFDNMNIQFMDITNQPMNNILKNNNCVLLTISSTAAIEAGSLGGTIIWAPFISANSITTDALLKHIGKVTEDESELIQELNYIAKLNEQQFNAYTSNQMKNLSDFYADKTFDEVLVDIYQTVN